MGEQLPLVLLPGMMCDARLFAPQLPALAERGPVQVVRFDQEDSIDAMAETVLAVAPARFALAGLSMGGIVAMAVLARAAERVAQLALIDTNPLAEGSAVRSGRAAQIARAERGELAAMMQDTFIPRYAGMAPLSPDIAKTCLNMAVSLGPQVFIRQSIALRDRSDSCSTLQSYSGKTLILCGGADALCPIERHEVMSGLMPHARLTVLDGMGHLPTLEAPKLTTDALLGWLENSA